MSPYLFVLCMERLGHLIRDRVSEKRWRPVHLGRNGLPLSHLFFADDLFLFAEASIQQAHAIKDSLNQFCESSSQKVNVNKTRVFFSKNISTAKANQLSSFLGFQVTKDLGKYLGAPLIHNRHSKSIYEELLNRVRSKLSG